MASAAFPWRILVVQQAVESVTRGDNHCSGQGRQAGLALIFSLSRGTEPWSAPSRAASGRCHRAGGNRDVTFRSK